MTSIERALVLAAAGQVLLTLIASALLLRARVRAIRAGLNLQDTAADLGRYPEPARVAAANVSNQFETPLLFLAAIAIALAMQLGTALLAALAWLWLLTRAIHLAIHQGPNIVRWRAIAFAAGFGLLGVMWAILAARAITG